MTNINIDDILFATLTQRGRTIANMCLCGMTSMANIMQSVRQNSPDTTGLATLSVRNSSQGWKHTQTFYLT